MRLDAGTLERLRGALLGVAVGDALGATLEFARPQPAESLHTEISGGGVFGWAPGAPTDDTDLTIAVAEAYAAGFSLKGVADRFLAWYQAGPKDVGGTTAAALRGYAQRRDPRSCGRADDRSAANGSLMRTMPVAIARSDPSERRREAAAVSAITHAEPRCIQACVVYCDLADALFRGIPVADALAEARETPGLLPGVADVLTTAPRLAVGQLDTSGYVLGTLGVAVWAISQPLGFEDVLVAVVNRGGDADTTGAVAGGLLGARDGHAAIPSRWLDALTTRARLDALAAALAGLRGGGVPAPRLPVADQLTLDDVGELPRVRS
jgi:ADP-ribosyl-[dinitrogen reductase] hydrolase